MSPLSRGIFIIVSGAAEWVWCFILPGILCVQPPPLHLQQHPFPTSSHLYQAPGDGGREEEPRGGL